MKRIFAGLVLIPLCSIRAESPPESLRLADLLREAEKSNHSIQAAAARLDAARRAPNRAAAPADPELALTYVNDGVSSFTLGESEFANLGLTWSQESRYRGKREHATEIAEAEVGQATAALRQVQLQTRAAIEQAYAELYRIDRVSAILHETSTILDSLAAAARGRYEVGNGIQENVLKADTEVLRLEAEMARLEEERSAAVAGLAALLGRQSPFLVSAVTELPRVEVPASEDAVEAAAASAAAAIESSRASLSRSEAALAASRLESKSNLRWSAGYQYRGDLEPMVMGAIAFRLPIYRGRSQTQAVFEAEDALQAARQDLAETGLKTSADARAIWARARRADRLVELYEKGVIVQARAALASAQASYGVGRLDFLDLLNDLTVLLGVRREAVTQEAERMQALAALESLTGQRLIAVDPPTPGPAETP